MMINHKGTFIWLFPAINEEIVKIITYFGYFGGIITLCIIRAKPHLITFKFIGFSLLLYMFLFPHIHIPSQDWSILFIASLAMVLTVIESDHLSRRVALIIPVCVSLYFMFFNAIFQSLLAVDVFLLSIFIALWFLRRILTMEKSGWSL